MGGRGHKLVLRRQSGLYLLSAPWLEKPIRHRDPVHTVCDLVVHLIHGFIASNPSVLCLHSAAALMGGRLVVFPNVYRGGKSLLSAHLAAAVDYSRHREGTTLGFAFAILDGVGALGAWLAGLAANVELELAFLLAAALALVAAATGSMLGMLNKDRAGA